MQTKPLYRYIASVFCLAAAMLTLALALTTIVDPYNIHHASRWADINAIKPRAYVHADLTKTTMAMRVKPNGVILGNSRMDIGFDPESPEWPDIAYPVFNLAVPGHPLASDLRRTRTVFRDRSPKIAVIGIDFIDFLYDGKSPSISQAATAPSQVSIWQENAFTFMKTTLSTTAVADSLHSVWQQSNPNAANMTTRGFNTIRQYLDYVRAEGHHALFHQKNVQNIKTYIRKPKYVVDQTGHTSPDFETLIHLIRWFRERNTAVKFVIYPYHADLLEAFHRTGLWPVFEDWKRVLARIVSAERSPGRQQDIVLWDFSGYHAYATERVPKKGDTRTHMTWYWEGGHFKAALGNLILRRIFTHEGPANFGVRLTEENVGSVIRQIRHDAQAYRTRQPGAASNIDRIVRRLSAPDRR